MKREDYYYLIEENARDWGIGPWNGEVDNFDFVTKNGFRAAVRREGYSGFLQGFVAIQNPDHPNLKLSPGIGHAFPLKCSIAATVS